MAYRLRGMISEEQIPAAAGYRASRYVLERHFTIVNSRVEVERGVWSCYGEKAHWFEVFGKKYTDQVSAAAIRPMIKKEQAARVEPPVIWTPQSGANV